MMKSWWPRTRSLSILTFRYPPGFSHAYREGRPEIDKENPEITEDCQMRQRLFPPTRRNAAHKKKWFMCYKNRHMSLSSEILCPSSFCPHHEELCGTCTQIIMKFLQMKLIILLTAFYENWKKHSWAYVAAPSENVCYLWLLKRQTNSPTDLHSQTLIRPQVGWNSLQYKSKFFSRLTCFCGQSCSSTSFLKNHA